MGAGAVVLERIDVPPGSLVLGFPAKVVRVVTDSMRAQIDHAWRHYVENAHRHKAGEYPLLK